MEEAHQDIEIVAIDVMKSGVVVLFSNGESVVYSATLLYSIRDQAERLKPDIENG